MDSVQQFTATYGWQLLAIGSVIIMAIGLRWYGRMLERQTREHGEQLNPPANLSPPHRSVEAP